MKRLQLTADLERGAVELRRDPVRVDEVIRGVLPTIQSLGENRKVKVSANLAPALPRVSADRTYLAEALSILLKGAVDRAPDGDEVRVAAESSSGSIRVTIQHAPGSTPPLERALVRQLSRAMGMSLTESPTETSIELPIGNLTT
jgi:K+-sensing histidine kinase KdpD